MTKSTCVGVRGVAPVEVGVDEFAEELVVRREEGIELRPSGAKRGVGRGGERARGWRDCARRPAGRGVHTCGLTRSRAARAAWEALESSRFVKDSGFFFAERACGRWWEVGGGGRRRAARAGGCCAAAKERRRAPRRAPEEGRTSHWLALHLIHDLRVGVEAVKFERQSSAGASSRPRQLHAPDGLQGGGWWQGCGTAYHQILEAEEEELRAPKTRSALRMHTEYTCGAAAAVGGGGGGGAAVVRAERRRERRWGGGGSGGGPPRSEARGAREGRKAGRWADAPRSRRTPSRGRGSTW